MIRLLSDSACDLSLDYAAAHKVELIPLYVTFDGETYYKDKLEVDRDEFYHQMVDLGAFPMSSLPSVEDYYNKFEEVVKAGDSAICITITNTLSGSFGSAHTAYEMIMEEYPDAQIAVYDSLQDTVSQALVLEEMIRMRDDGLSFEQMNEKMPALVDSGVIVFTVGSLEYLRKGGRIGKLATTAAGKLNLRPLLILEHGKLGIGGISRTRKRSIDDVINYTEKYFSSPEHDVKDYLFHVGHGHNREEGNEFRSMICERLGIQLEEQKENAELTGEIGAITAVHTGPHALGIGFVKKYDLL